MARVQVQSAATIAEIVVVDPNGVPEALQVVYARASVLDQVLGVLPAEITIRHRPNSCGAELDGDAIVFLAERSGHFQRTYALDVNVHGNVSFEGEVLSVAQCLGRL